VYALPESDEMTRGKEPCPRPDKVKYHSRAAARRESPQLTVLKRSRAAPVESRGGPINLAFRPAYCGY
jgi:hypothetical protein